MLSRFSALCVVWLALCFFGSDKARSQGNINRVYSLTVAPQLIMAGGSGIGTITISGTTPSAPLQVVLTSSQVPLVSVPATVELPAGATSATFPFEVLSVSVTTAINVTITATLNFQSKIVVLKVIPSGILPTFSITDLGTLGGPDSQATGLSGSVGSGGSVVGFSTNANGYEHAFVWMAAGGMRELNAPTDSTRSRAMAVNSYQIKHGDVVTTALGVVGTEYKDGLAFPTFWPTGNLTTAAPIHLTGDGDTIHHLFSAAGINHSGQIALTAGIGSDCCHQHDYAGAFFFSSQTQLVALGTLPGIPSGTADAGRQAAANGINDAGDVVGWSDVCCYGQPGGQPVHAFLWRAAVGMIDLRFLSYSTNSRANAINNNGEVVGFAGHAFHWRTDFGLLDIGTLGGPSAEATAINDLGQIVGFSDTLGGTSHAFLWVSTYGMVDLNDLIPPGNGWELIEAHGINYDGEVVGWGFYNGNKRAFLLTIHPLVLLPHPPTGLAITVH